VTIERLPRWEGDERGSGIGNARTFVGAVDDLRAAMLAERWVAEDPDVHLLPKIRDHFAGSPSELRLRDYAVSEGLLVVELEAPAKMRPADIRSAVFAVVGTIVETATFIRESGTTGPAQSRVFDLLTGSLDGDSPFAGHGHTVRIVVTRGPDL
jgi:hypothetical protein